MASQGSGTTQTTVQSYIIKRPRLTKLLDESEARIILLVAPAGYGKTTLAREWLATRSERVAWYSGGPAMADVAALASGLAELLSSDEEADKSRDLVRRVASRAQDANLLAKSVATAARTTKYEVLVVDDYHRASVSEASESFFGAFFPLTSIRVLIASRLRPSWASSRRVVYGEMSVIEMHDLAFTDDEAREVLGVDAPQRVVLQAGGWPAVIGLAARRRLAGGFDANLLPGELYTFFAEDLFQTLSPSARRALFAIALGGTSRPDVARELAGNEFEGVSAEANERGFLSRAQGGSISMHPLLRRFLISKLRELNTHQVDRILRRVVKVLVRHHLWDDCLVALDEFPRGDLVLSVLRRALNELLSAGRMATVRRWLEVARNANLSSPTLLLAEAELALRERDDRRAQTLGTRAAELIARGNEAAQAYLVAARAAHLAGESAAVRRNCERARAIEGIAAETSIDALWLEFLSAFETQEREAAEIATRVSRMRDERPGHALRVASARAIIALESDRDAHRGLRECEVAESLADHVGDPISRSSFLNTYTYAALAVCQYERALALAVRQVTEAQESGIDFAVDHALVCKARALIGLRKLSQAQRVLDALKAREGGASGFILIGTRLELAKLRIAVGDVERASIILRPQPEADLPLGLRGEYFAYRALYAAARGELSGAKKACKGACALSRFIDTFAVSELARAIIAVREDSANGVAHAQRGIGVTLECGHLDAIVTACRSFPHLAKCAAASNDAIGEALRNVFSLSRDADLGRYAGLEMPRELRREEGLSPREREVYEHLVQGRTNKEIAKALFISESTTKIHVRHIFEKLAVHTRAEAARLAGRDPPETT